MINVQILLLVLLGLCICLYFLIPEDPIRIIEDKPGYTQQKIICTVPKSRFSTGEEYYSYFTLLLKGELQESLTNETLHTIQRSMKGLASFYHMDTLLTRCIQSGKCDVVIPSPIHEPLIDKIDHSVANNILTLIQGPPGTGKTYTSAEIIARYITKNPTHKIVVCSPSNDPLVALKEKVVDNLKQTVQGIDIHYSYTYSKNNKEYTDNDPYNIINKMKEWKKKSLYTEQEILRMLVKQSRILFTTCTSIIDPMFDHVSFDLILIDEASRCIEPEAILPFVKAKHTTHCVLVGDDKQLGPVVTAERIKRCLSISLFKRLISLGTIPTYTLNVQYRMHPDISNYSYPFFYTTPIQNYDEDCSSKECQDWYTLYPHFVTRILAKYTKARPLSSKILQPNYITAGWIDNTTQETLVDNYTYMNVGESEVVCKLVKECIESGIKPSQITILVPYKRQMTLFGCVPDVSVKTIDSYQGRDNDVIILSLVRSNDKGDIGFLGEEERINVALTRAKRALFIVGNKQLFANSSDVWKQISSLF